MFFSKMSKMPTPALVVLPLVRMPTICLRTCEVSISMTLRAAWPRSIWPGTVGRLKFHQVLSVNT